MSTKDIKVWNVGRWCNVVKKGIFEDYNYSSRVFAYINNRRRFDIAKSCVQIVHGEIWPCFHTVSTPIVSNFIFNSVIAWSSLGRRARGRIVCGDL